MMTTKESYPRFVACFAIFFFLFPVVLGTFNYCIDPNHRYRFSVPEETLRTLSRSPQKVLTVPENYDDRALLKKYIQASDPPAIILLGGSRILNLHADMFQGQWQSRILNAGVTNGTIRDYVALWQMMKEKGIRPRWVFLCIEEQSMNSISQNNRYLSLIEFYERFFQKGLSLRIKFMGLTTDFKDLLSLQTTLASFKSFANRGKVIAGHLVDRSSFSRLSAARTSAFSVLYPSGYAQKKLAEILSLGNANGRGECRIFQMWNSKDSRGIDHLAALMDDIKGNGSTPILIGMPYQPEAYRVIEQNATAFTNMKLFVKQLTALADQKGVFFYDGIIEHHGDFSANDFMDGVHLNEKANYRFLKQAASAAGLSIINQDF